MTRGSASLSFEVVPASPPLVVELASLPMVVRLASSVVACSPQLTAKSRRAREIKGRGVMGVLRSVQMGC